MNKPTGTKHNSSDNNNRNHASVCVFVPGERAKRGEKEMTTITAVV
jgi:hypothetical protein